MGVASVADTAARINEGVQQRIAVPVAYKQADGKLARLQITQKDQSTRDKACLPGSKPSDTIGVGFPKDKDSVQQRDAQFNGTGRSVSKAEAPNRWSKALGGFSPSSSAGSTPASLAQAVGMAPGAPAPKQPLKAPQQAAPSSKGAYQQQPRPSGKASSGNMQGKEANSTGAANAAVRVIPRNSISPNNGPRRTSSGGSAAANAGAAKQAQQQERGELAAGQQQTRNWAGIVSSRPQTQLSKQPQHQQKQARRPEQPSTAMEPFPPLAGDADWQPPQTSRAWPAPPPPSSASSSKAGNANTGQQASAGAVDPVPASTTPAAPVIESKPAATSNGGTVSKQDSFERPPTDKEPVGKEQSSKGSKQWMAKQQPQRVGSGDSLTGRDSYSPRAGRGARSSAGGRASSHLKPQETSNSSSISAQPLGQPVPIAAAPAGLPPTPSSALTSRAASAAASAAVAGAVLAAAVTQQAQHKAVNLPSSQEVNTAAMSDYANNRSAGSGIMGYRLPAEAPAPPSAAGMSGFEEFGAGFGPGVYNDGNNADSFSGNAVGFSASSFGASGPATSVAAPPSAPPAPQTIMSAGVMTAAAPPAASAQMELTGQDLETNITGSSGSHRAAYLEQDHNRSSNAAARPSSSSGAAPAPSSSLGVSRKLSADAPAFTLSRPTLVPTQVHTSAAAPTNSKGDASERGSSGVLNSAQLEQQLFATAQEVEGPKAAATSARVNSNGSVAASTGTTSTVAAQLRSLADKVEQEASQRNKAALESADKLRQMQQQLDAAKAAQTAAEAKVADLNNELDVERRNVQDLEAQLAAQTNLAGSHAERANALAAELAAIHQVRDTAAVEAGQHMQALQQQIHDMQLAQADLEHKLRQWQERYNSTEADNKGLREMLGPRAPAPGTSFANTAAAATGGPAAFEGAAPPAPATAPVSTAATSHRPGAKAPPPGFGPAPAAPAAPQPPAAAAPEAAKALHMKNEHELVSTLLSMLQANPHAAITWGEDETAGLDVQLVPLNWAMHYSARYGSIISFMQQRPAVFAQRPDGAFYKVLGAEEMVKKAMADEEERARATAAEQQVTPQTDAQPLAIPVPAATAGWHVPQFGADLGSGGGAGSGPSSFEGWSNHQQHVGMPSSVPFLAGGLGMGMSMPFMPMPPPPHAVMPGTAAGLGPQRTMPMAPPSVPLGHGMHHQMHHGGHSGW